MAFAPAWGDQSHYSLIWVAFDGERGESVGSGAILLHDLISPGPEARPQLILFTLASA